MKMPMLEVEKLMVFYENALAVNNFSFKVSEGQIVGLFGMNSAGKSTLMFTVAGAILDLKKKEDMRGGERITILGSIRYYGKEVIEVKPSDRARMGVVLCPERRRIFPESSTLENLKIGAYLANKAQFQETLDYVFELFPHLKKVQRRQGGFLSGGEQQMLAIGRALMVQPRLLLLDEPFLGLSLGIQNVLIEAIKNIRERRRVTVLVSEQYARPLFPIIDYGYIIENGTVVVEGTGDDLVENPDVKAAYFGI
jgi:branched-chain amino acid transport system ATP-binding protein